VFLTRSIRRKLVVVLALVMLMLSVLVVAGVFGLRSYRELVHDIDNDLRVATERSELIEAVGGLAVPLRQGPEELLTPVGAVWRAEHCIERVGRVREHLQNFVDRLEQLPADSMDPGQRALRDQLIAGIGDGLRNYEQLCVQLADPGQHDAARLNLLNRVADLHTMAASLPTPPGLYSRLREAPRIYKFLLWLTVGCSAAAMVAFVLMIRWGYLWVFQPIRRLHQGVMRVAQGDFNYRLKLVGKDEMAELADSFNKMAARFQEIKTGLDREVQQRSRELVRSERLAGVGFLSAGVAHEINNPLSAIAMAAESLESRLLELSPEAAFAGEDRDLMRTYLQMIQREAFRCQQITRKLLDFSRGQDAPRSEQDLARIVADVVDMVGHMSKFRGHDVVFDRSRPCRAVVNGAELKQVILNLTANALESMEGRGRLEILAEEHADEIVLTFVDSGCGMSPHVQENLFEPFFTAKTSGRGTGLGLSISHRIVAEHGGRIQAFSEGPGKGSTFCVHLPRRAAPSQEQEDREREGVRAA
jgi:two-component system, NtrC family, sensor kinase